MRRSFSTVDGVPAGELGGSAVGGSGRVACEGSGCVRRACDRRRRVIRDRRGSVGRLRGDWNRGGVLLVRRSLVGMLRQNKSLRSTTITINKYLFSKTEGA